jgi:PAS domain S-box-containing protein
MNVQLRPERRAQREPALTLFREVAEQWPGAVLLINREGFLRWYNESARDWLPDSAYERDEIPVAALQLPWLEGTSDLRAVLKGGARQYPARRAVDRRGRERYCSVRLLPLRRRAAIFGAMLFIDDASGGEGSTVVQAPTIAEADRAIALGAAQVGAWQRDLASGGGSIDPAWCETHRLDPCAGPDHLQRWERLVHPDDVAEYRAKCAEFVTAVASRFEIEYRMLTTDSKWVWILQRGAVIEQGEGGVPTRAAGICIEIDARKRAEVALQEKESRLATALWGARAAFWQWNITTDTSTRSPMWFAMTGYRREDWERESGPWNARLHPEDAERVHQAVRDHLEGRTQSLEIEYRTRIASGEYKWMQDRGRVNEWDFQGNPTVAIGVSLDIDAQKRAELVLRSTEARLETALWAAQIGLWDIDFTAGATRWHNDWCARIGLDVEASADRVGRWRTAVHPEDAVEVEQRFAAHVSGEVDHYDAEYRVRTSAGGWRWLFERGRVIDRRSDGTAARMVGVCMDIEERRAAERDAREVQRRLEAALGEARICVWEWDLVEPRIYCNDLYRQIVGGDTVPQSPEQHRANWLARMHEEDQSRILELEGRLLAGTVEEFESEYRLRTDEGTWRWVLERGRVTARQSTGRPARVAGFMVDVTERVKTEAALRESEERYRLVSELTPGYIFAYQFDDAGQPTQLYASDGYARIFGFPISEVERHGGINGCIEPESLADVIAYRERVRQGEVTTVEVRVRHVSGRVRWLQVHARPVRDWRSGAVIGAMGSAQDVTERRSAEQARADAVATLNAVTEHAPDLLMLLDRDLRVRFANRGWKNYRPADLVGRDAIELLPEPNRSEVRAYYQQVIATGRPVTAELIFRLTDGTVMYLEMRAAPVREDGVVTGLSVAITDHSAQRAAEARSRETESVLHTIAEVTSDWLAMLDRDLRCIFINRALDGHTPAEMIGRRVGDMGFRQLSGDLEGLLRGVLASGRPVTEEQEFAGSDGVPHTFELRVRPVSSAGAVTGVVVTGTEITERRSQERVLRTQARILQTMREGVVLTDGDNRIRLTNPAFDAMFRLPPDAILGRPIEPMLRRFDDTPGRLTADEAQRLEAGDTVPVDYEGVRADGTRFVAASMVTRIEIGAAPFRLTVVNDVTERKHLEREILEIANREQLRMGGDLHDGLGQDLTGIALMLRGVAGQLRKEESEARTDVEEIIGLVNAAIESTRVLARGLSPVSSERGGLIAALQSLATRTHERHGVKVHVTTRLDRRLVLGDTALNHLYRIAQEALSNAVRHGQPRDVTIQLVQDGERLHLVITDDGCGLPPSADAAAGLGLKLMRYRAQMLGGELTVQRNAGKGTRVECVCPIASNRRERA